MISLNKKKLFIILSLLKLQTFMGMGMNTYNGGYVTLADVYKQNLDSKNLERVMQARCALVKIDQINKLSYETLTENEKEEIYSEIFKNTSSKFLGFVFHIVSDQISLFFASFLTGLFFSTSTTSFGGISKFLYVLDYFFVYFLWDNDLYFSYPVNFLKNNGIFILTFLAHSFLELIFSTKVEFFFTLMDRIFIFLFRNTRWHITFYKNENKIKTIFDSLQTLGAKSSERGLLIPEKNKKILFIEALRNFSL